MKHLWSPWRMAYIEGHDESPECLFCSHLVERDGPKNLILVRGQRAFIILNRYPYTNGHCMVVPLAHLASLEDLDDPTRLEIMQLTGRLLTVLRKAYDAQAFNVGLNIGKAAGAGVEGHVHLHVVPRWSGDTNFMATTAETRVIPESLDQTYSRLLSAWREVATTS